MSNESGLFCELFSDTRWLPSTGKILKMVSRMKMIHGILGRWHGYVDQGQATPAWYSMRTPTDRPFPSMFVWYNYRDNHRYCMLICVKLGDKWFAIRMVHVIIALGFHVSTTILYLRNYVMPWNLPHQWLWLILWWPAKNSSIPWLIMNHDINDMCFDGHLRVSSILRETKKR